MAVTLAASLVLMAALTVLDSRFFFPCPLGKERNRWKRPTDSVELPDPVGIKMRQIVRIQIGVLAGIILLASGCGSSVQEGPMQSPASFPSPDIATTLDVSEEYRIGPSDLVTVSVYRAPEVSGDMRVDDLGRITLPLIGQVDARGLTADELRTRVAQELAKKYYEHPSVTVTLKEAASQRIIIDGSVTAPGAYAIARRTTLMEAVALAKGTTQNANLRKVVVFRTVNGERMAAAFDLAAIRANSMADPEVFGSDIIIVDGSETRQKWRDVLTAVPLIALFRPFLF